MNKKEKGAGLEMNRRQFLNTVAAIGAVTVVPRSVLGKGHIAPSDKITFAHIGCGTQALQELKPLLENPRLQSVAIADPVKSSGTYVHWGKTELRDNCRNMMGDSKWHEGVDGIWAGRDIYKEVVDSYHKKNNKGGAVAAFADYREMFEKVKDIDAVKIMTPDHLHAYIALDCMKRGVHSIMHKPLGNTMYEALKVVEQANKSNTATHFMPYNSIQSGDMPQIKAWIDAGAIGKLREIHTWSFRPMWPQYEEIPTANPAIPKGMDWDLWLGPAQNRPYNPEYTHATFRGWYDFGGGSIADMGHYNMWAVFDALQLGHPRSASSYACRNLRLKDSVPYIIQNDFSFPQSCVIRMNIETRDKKDDIDFFWYDGGMKPNAPKELGNVDLPLEGMLVVGDNGMIIGDFFGGNPKITNPTLAAKYADVKAAPQGPGPNALKNDMPMWLSNWMDSASTGEKHEGHYGSESAKYMSEVFNLAAIALRSGKPVEFDAESMRITNSAEANKLIKRECRTGWEIDNLL